MILYAAKSVSQSNGATLSTYKALRHLFTEARNSSVGDRRWHLAATFTEPGTEVMTEYQHAISYDRIKCESTEHNPETGEYMEHCFTFTDGETERKEAEEKQS